MLKLVLPFAVAAEDRAKVFSKDMEMAAVLYLAESNRAKGEGILRRPDEKLVFVAEGSYPVWLVPWSGGTLVFDGLGVSAHTVSYDRLPNVKTFNKDIQRNAKTCNSYSAALSRNAGYFKSFAGKEKKTIEGLITSQDFVRDFSTYLSDVDETEKPLTRKAVLSRLVNEPEIAASVAEISDLREKVQGDVKNLDRSMRLLSTTTRERVKAGRVEIKRIRKNSGRQIAKIKPKVGRRICHMKAKYNGKIRRVSELFGRRLRHLREDQVRSGKMLRHLRVEANHCEARIKCCRRHKKRRSERQWTKRLKRIKKRLPSFEKSIRDAEKKIVSLEAAKRHEASHLRLERDNCIAEAGKILREHEASREASIKMKRQEISSMKESTSLIVNQMRAMVRSKKAALKEFDGIGMSRRKRGCALVYLPFYLVRYQREGKNRFVVYPPSIVSGMGIMTKMKGALGAAKMKTFLQPRSKAITLFLNRLVTLIQKNPVFGKDVTNAGIQDSILRIKKLRIGVKRGLKELKDEEWMSKNEVQALSKLLYIYA